MYQKASSRESERSAERNSYCNINLKTLCSNAELTRCRSLYDGLSAVILGLKLHSLHNKSPDVKDY